MTLLNQNRLGTTEIAKGMEEIIDPVQKNYMSLAYSYKDNYKNGATFLNEKKLAGDLVFQTYYSTNISGFIKNSLSGLLDKFKGDAGFFIFYFILLIVLTGILVKRINRQFRERDS